MLFLDLLCLTGSIAKAPEERLSRKEIFNKILLTVSANRAEVGTIEVSSHILHSGKELLDTHEVQPTVHSALYLKCIPTIPWPCPDFTMRQVHENKYGL